MIKLDMTNAHDRVLWFFMMKVLMKMGFHEFEVDINWRLLAKILYSIVIMGSHMGSFTLLNW